MKYLILYIVLLLSLHIETLAQIQDKSDNRLSIIVPKASAMDIDFGQVLNNTKKDSVFAGYLQNTGKFAVRIDNITIAGDHANDFRLLTYVFPFSIPSNSGRDIEFRFNPQSSGMKTADVVIVTQADTLIYKISGESVEAKIEVYSGIVDFGKVPIFSQSDRAISKAIKNIGTSPIKITSISIDNESGSQFSLTDKFTPFSLAPNETKELNIGFAPVKDGRTDGRIIVSYENQTQPAILKLFGEGTPVFATVKGTVKTTNGSPLEVKVGWELMSENYKNVEIGTTNSSPSDGSYEFKVPIGSNYAFYFQKKGYSSISDNAMLKGQKKETTITKDIIMKKPWDGSITVNNIFFEYNKSDLRPESYSELDRLVELLKEYPNVKVEISGHTDSDGSDSYNKRLSQSRAQSVVNYLIKKGINKNNLIAIGYGESKPIADNKTDEGKAKNRRVEFKFLK